MNAAQCASCAQNYCDQSPLTSQARLSRKARLNSKRENLLFLLFHCSQQGSFNPRRYKLYSNLLLKPSGYVEVQGKSFRFPEDFRHFEPR